MWLLMTAVVAWLLSLVWGRGHLHLTNRDGYIITAISFAFWLIMTANIANQLTIAVELNEDAITVSTVLRGRRQLLVGEIQEVRHVSNGRRAGVKLIPIDPGRKPISFAIDVLTPHDQETVRAFISGKPKDT